MLINIQHIIELTVGSLENIQACRISLEIHVFNAELCHDNAKDTLIRSLYFQIKIDLTKCISAFENSLY